MLAAASFVVAVTLATWGQVGMLLAAAVLGCLLVRARTSCCVLLAASLAGGCIGSAWLQQALSARVPVQAADRSVSATGVIVSLPRRLDGFPGGADGWRFDLQLQAPLPSLPAVRRLRVSWYPAQAQRPCMGQSLAVQLRLRPPRGPLNPYAADRARNLLARGVDGYARVEALQGAPQVACNDRRQRLSERLRNTLGQGVAAALVPALVVGDRRFLDEQHWQVLRRTGTVHLVAISGLHVSLVAWLVWWLARWLLALPAAFSAGRHDAAVLALVPASLMALGYAWLAGFSAPTLRALVMALLVFALRASGWRLSVGRILALALALLLALQPGLSLMPGFWLSVLAVALLGLLAGLPRPLLQGHALMTLGVGLVAGAWFAHWSLSALLVNLVMVPLFAVLVIPLALSGSLLPGADALLHLCAWILDGLWPALQAAARLPGLPLPVSQLVMLALLAAAVLAVRPGLPGARWLLPLAALLLVPTLHQRPETGQFDLLAFDVGQGQSVAIRTRNTLLLYDTGPDGALAARQLLPWLLRQPQGERMLVVSHGDSDHAGGVARLVPALSFRWKLSGQPQRLPGFSACRRGQRWQHDGVVFSVLWPPVDRHMATANNNSCVLRVSNGDFSVVLSGDIEKPVEYWLLENGLAPADVVTVPHHGSRSSSSFAGIRRLQPRYALVSAGWKNRFSHPAPSVVARWQSFGADVVNTAVAGAIHIDASGVLTRWRQAHVYPWRQGAPVVE